MEGELKAVPGLDAAIHHAHDLDGALKYLKALRPQLIILDLDLEDSSGVDTFTKVHKACPVAPVVIMADPHHRDDIIAAVKGGAMDVLIKKPKSEAHLQTVLERAIVRNSKEIFHGRINKIHVRNLAQKLRQFEGGRSEDQLALIYEVSSALMHAIHGKPSDEENDFLNEDNH